MSTKEYRTSPAMRPVEVEAERSYLSSRDSIDARVYGREAGWYDGRWDSGPPRFEAPEDPRESYRYAYAQGWEDGRKARAVAAHEDAVDRAVDAVRLVRGEDLAIQSPGGGTVEWRVRALLVLPVCRESCVVHWQALVRLMGSEDWARDILESAERALRVAVSEMADLQRAREQGSLDAWMFRAPE